MLKVYLNDDPKLVGVKYDDYRHTQILVSATGSIKEGVTVSFAPYERKVHGDFNAAHGFTKDYDYDFVNIFKKMLGIEKANANYSLKETPDPDCVVVCVAEEKDGTIKGIEALADRLKTILSRFGDIN